jgi:hypothetical protein
MSRPTRLADLADVLIAHFAIPRAVAGLRKRGG